MQHSPVERRCQPGKRAKKDSGGGSWRHGGVGLAIAFLLAQGGCRVQPDADSDAARISAVERLQIEVGNLELDARRLQRTRDRLRREVELLGRETMQAERGQREALGKQQEKRRQLANALETLKFSEEALAEAKTRGEEARLKLQRIADDESTLIKLQARAKELPAEIAKLEAALQGPAEQARALLAELQAKHGTAPAAATPAKPPESGGTQSGDQKDKPVPDPEKTESPTKAESPGKPDAAKKQDK